MADRIFGINPVFELLRSHPHRIQEIFLPSEPLHGKKGEIFALAREQNVKVQRIPRSKFDQLLGKEAHQGVLCIVSPYSFQSLEALIQRWRDSGEKALFLILDSVEDPRNFGAIARTAAAVGVHGIIIPKHRSAPINTGAEKAAAGAFAHTPVCRVTNLVSAIEELKKEGLWIVGTAEDGEQSLYDFDFVLDLAVVVGSEEKGLHDLVRRHCDYLLSIPVRGAIPSLNASVAAAVVLYEAARQRHYRSCLPSK
jgi:23S rRNA (guanosine2251-2'-O)-methyltransferase